MNNMRPRSSENFNSIIKALKEGLPTAEGYLIDYYEAFATNLESFRIKKFAGEFDDAVVEN